MCCYVFCVFRSWLILVLFLPHLVRLLLLLVRSVRSVVSFGRQRASKWANLNMRAREREASLSLSELKQQAHTHTHTTVLVCVLELKCVSQMHTVGHSECEREATSSKFARASADAVRLFAHSQGSSSSAASQQVSYTTQHNGERARVSACAAHQ